MQTVFTAVNLMDRFLMYSGHWTFPREYACLLATASLLLAVKMEEKKMPCYERMINLLSKDEQLEVSKETLVVLE